MRAASPTSTPASEPDLAARTERLQLVVGTVLLALASLWAAVAFGRELVAAGVLSEWNVLFDADPNVYHRNFATGRSLGFWGGRSFVHPNLTNFVHFPIRALSELLAWLPLDLGSARELRLELALFVSPLIAAVRVPLLVLLLRSLGLSAGWTLTLCALDTASFSTRLFASIPESYLLSGTLLVLVFWMGIEVLRGKPPRFAAWIAALFLLGGVATVNLNAAAVILGVALRRHYSGVRSLLIAAALVLGAFGLNAVAYQASRTIYPSAPPFNVWGTHHIEDGWNPGVPRLVFDYPRALANAYMPPPPGLREEYYPENHHAHVLTFERGSPGVAAIDPRPLIFLVFLALGIASYRWLPAEHRGPYQIAVVILGIGGLLHGMFGKELVLYTQHWKIGVLVLLAGLYHLPPVPRTLAGRALVVLVIGMIVSNALVMRDVLLALARA